MVHESESSSATQNQDWFGTLALLGLGMEQKRQREEEVIAAAQEAKRAKLQKEEIPDYRQRLRESNRRKHVQGDMYGSQRVCEDLDRRQACVYWRRCNIFIYIYTYVYYIYVSICIVCMYIYI